MADPVVVDDIESVLGSGALIRRDLVALVQARSRSTSRESVMKALAFMTVNRQLVVAPGDVVSLAAKAHALPPPSLALARSLGPPKCAPVTTQKQLRELLAPRSSAASSSAAAAAAASALESAKSGDDITSQTQHDTPPDLTAEQASVLNLVAQGRSVFFTGPAGTGKSYLLKLVVAQESSKRRVFVTAPTGMASCLIGGTTINSWAGIGLGSAFFCLVRARARVLYLPGSEQAADAPCRRGRGNAD